MSIWGKVIGGVAGFAIGGPLGAILGATAGHAVDKARRAEAADGFGDDDDSRQVAFTTAVIVLCAKMAKSDGQVTTDEIATFKRIFQIPPGEQENVGRIFNEAREEAAGFEPYAQQIASLFSRQPAVLEEILGALFAIARADGVIHPDELRFVREVAMIFGFDAHRFEQLKTIYSGDADQESDAYEVLGLTSDATDAEIKTTYRKLIRKYHPDTLTAQGLPQEFIDLANEKMAAINGAYDRIEKQRGLK